MLHEPLQHWLLETHAPPVGAQLPWQTPPVQTLLMQSALPTHVWPFAHSGQVPPPQSTPVSVPFLTPSLHAGALQV